MKFDTSNIVWTAVIAALLSGLSILVSPYSQSVAIACGLAAITNAVLATRE